MNADASIPIELNADDSILMPCFAGEEPPERVSIFTPEDDDIPIEIEARFYSPFEIGEAPERVRSYWQSRGWL